MQAAWIISTISQGSIIENRELRCWLHPNCTVISSSLGIAKVFAPKTDSSVFSCFNLAYIASSLPSFWRAYMPSHAILCDIQTCHSWVMFIEILFSASYRMALHGLGLFLKVNSRYFFLFFDPTFLHDPLNLKVNKHRCLMNIAAVMRWIQVSSRMSEVVS